MVIILALCIPVTAMVTGFFVLKGVQLGLEIQKPKETPVKEIMEVVEKPQQQPETKPIQIDEILNEWLNGGEKD